MPTEKFSQIYAELIFQGELHRDSPAGFTAVRDSILRANGSDSASFYQTLEWYSADPARLQKALELTGEKIRARRQLRP